MLAVANTAHLPWAPGESQAPHWILPCGHDDGTWLVQDRFVALLPHGEQTAYQGRLGLVELSAALSPVPDPANAVRHGDALALGEPIPLLPANRFRWLGRIAQRPAEHTGDWLTEPVAVLRLLAEELAVEENRLAAHLDDMWAIGRHLRFKLASSSELISVKIGGRMRSRIEDRGSFTCSAPASRSSRRSSPDGTGRAARKRPACSATGSTARATHSQGAL